MWLNNKYLDVNLVNVYNGHIYRGERLEKK